MRDAPRADSWFRVLCVCLLSIPRVITKAPNQTLLPSDSQKCNDWRDAASLSKSRVHKPTSDLKLLCAILSS